MSNFFGDDSFSVATPAAVTWQEPVKGKGAPWIYLVVGLALITLVFVAKLLFPANGESAWVSHLFYWILSMAAFLAPIAAFSLIDLKRRLDPNYSSQGRTVRQARFGFLLLGLVFSIVNVFFLASELARVLNVG